MSDIFKENNEHVENNMDYSSLPPRGTIHKVENKKSKSSKWNFTQLTLVFFLLILVVSPLVFYQFYGSSKEADGPLPIKTQPIEVVEGDFESNTNKSNQTQKKDSVVNTNEQTKQSNSTSLQSSTNDSNQNTQSSLDNSNPEKNNEALKQHVVAKGENLYRISLKYYDTGEFVEELAKFNGLNNPNDIFEGLVLEIPDQKILVQ